MVMVGNQRPPQELGIRRGTSTINPISGNNTKTPLGIFGRAVNIETFGNKEASRSLLQLPSNRQFGFFPIAKGTTLTAKKYRRPLAYTEPYDETIDGLKINTQEQNTQVQVMGVNYEKAFTIKERFAGYVGNAAEGDLSQVKHADSAKKSNAPSYIGSQLQALKSNPIVKEIMKRGRNWEKEMRQTL